MPTARAAETSLVECAMVRNQTYVRLAENVIGTGERFYVEGIAQEDAFRVAVDPSDVQVFQRERTEIVLDFSYLRSKDGNVGVIPFSLVLHDMLLSDGTHVDIPVDEAAFEYFSPLRFYKEWKRDENNVLYAEGQNNNFETVYSVVVGTVWTLQEPEGGFGDAYLHEHAEMTVDGAAPQIEGDTFTFNTPGECVIKFRCCGDFAVQKTIVRVLTKPEIKRELFILTLIEGFEYGMGIGYWLGPWWLPLSIPGGIVYGMIKAVRILFA